MQCTFKAAERKTAMFITNIHSSTVESDIVKYIYNKTQETVVLEQIHMKVERGHKAYKFFIMESKVNIFMNENLWPAGIIFRQFMNFNQKKTSGIPSVNGINKDNNE